MLICWKPMLAFSVSEASFCVGKHSPRLRRRFSVFARHFTGIARHSPELRKRFTASGGHFTSGAKRSPGRTQHSPDLGDHFIVVGRHFAAVALRSPDLKKQSTSLRKHFSGASNCSRRWRDLATSAHRARTKGDKVVRVS